MIAWLSLGSNLGDRLATLTSGVRHLAENPHVRIEAVSSVYETEPVGYLAQPAFLNAGVRLRTDLAPLALLDACQAAEQAEGRRRSFPNAPRTLDIDIVACEREGDEEGGAGEVLMSTPRLTLPHVRAAERQFVQVPLAELRTGCTGRAPGIEPWLWGWTPLADEVGSREAGSDLAPHRLMNHVLVGARYPTHLLYLSTTGSTNDEAKRLAQAGAADGTVVVAEGQSSGRGSKGRIWESATGLGVWMSVVLRPSVHTEHVGLVPLAASVAVCRALRRLGAVDAGIQWPNDLLDRGRKIAGILCESASAGGTVDWVVVGIGIDVLHGPEDLPAGLEVPAVSLRLCREQTAPGAGNGELRARVAASVLYELGETVRMLSTGAAGLLMDEYRRDSLLLGRRVRLQGPDGTCDALAKDVDDQGRLLVEAADGLHALDSVSMTVRTVQEGTSS